jgi:hypothetical protein
MQQHSQLEPGFAIDAALEALSLGEISDDQLLSFLN